MIRDLQSTQVHLWYLSFEDQAFNYLLRDERKSITSEEVAYSERFLTEKTRQTYLATRSFIRILLSRYADVSPSSWRFDINPRGKPRISTPVSARSLRFSLSKGHGILTCGISFNREIGVDTECLDRAVEVEEIAGRYFAGAEIASLHGLSVIEQRRQFFKLWTLKESYLKARGIGLSPPLQKFAFVIDKHLPVTVNFDPSLVDDPGNWYFSLVEPTKGYLTAVALARLPAERNESWRAAIKLAVRSFE